MKRHPFVRLDMTNKCANCDEIIAHPVHATTLAQQQGLVRDRLKDLGREWLALVAKVLDWFTRERGRQR